MRSHFSPFLISLVSLWFTTSTSANEIETVQDIPVNPVAMSDESVAGGLKIYVRFCRACHGPGGVGEGPAGAARRPGLGRSRGARGGARRAPRRTAAESRGR